MTHQRSRGYHLGRYVHVCACVIIRQNAEALIGAVHSPPPPRIGYSSSRTMEAVCMVWDTAVVSPYYTQIIGVCVCAVQISFECSECIYEVPEGGVALRTYRYSSVMDCSFSAYIC